MTKVRALVELGLAAQAGLLTIAGLALLSLVQSGGWTVESLAPGLIFAALLMATYMALRIAGYGGEGVLLPLVGVLSGLGLLLAYRLGGDELGNRQ
ncbi:MAG: hypothetical protein Q8P59_07810, partial [Dehalococcoidia bacterium]|nr:hypothetical protein [Dehalococcoidia bacterium]